MNEPGIENRHLFRRGALLLAVDVSRTGHAGQGIVDIANGLDANAANALIEPRGVDAGDTLQSSPDGLDLVAVVVEEANPERRRHSGSAIVGGAATDADADAADAEVEGGGDQL